MMEATPTLSQAMPELADEDCCGRSCLERPTHMGEEPDHQTGDQQRWGRLGASLHLIQHPMSKSRRRR